MSCKKKILEGHVVDETGYIYRVFRTKTPEDLDTTTISIKIERLRHKTETYKNREDLCFSDGDVLRVCVYGDENKMIHYIRLLSVDVQRPRQYNRPIDKINAKCTTQLTLEIPYA
jgi:hypothetical protein